MASPALKTWRALQKRLTRGERRLSDEERRSLYLLRKGARDAGSVLANRGRGGLSPSLVLHVLRRDEYRCKRCGSSGQDTGGIQVHHKGGIVASRWLSKKGHRNEPNNIVTICSKCHDVVHTEAKAAGIDSSQVEPEGDR